MHEHCIDYRFSLAGLGSLNPEDGIGCRCGNEDNLISYAKVDDKSSAKVCNFNCNFTVLGGKVNYKCGGKNAYTVYNATLPTYEQPMITIEKKLNIMYNLLRISTTKGVSKIATCGNRTLSSRCDTFYNLTVDKCISYCREGNYSINMLG